MKNLDNIKVLAFDIFGTVVDWHSSIVAELNEMEIQVNTNQFALDWRAGYRPAMDKTLTGEMDWVSVDTIHRLILEELLIKYNILHLSEKQKSDLNLIWHRLRPWDDTVQGLNKLKDKYIICTLSNGNIRLLVDIAKYSNLPWDYIFSAENFYAYKPSPKTYLGVAELLDVKPNEILMVAAHHSDLAAARSCGLRTAYIERPLELGTSIKKDVSPCIDNDLHASDLLDLVDKMNK